MKLKKIIGISAFFGAIVIAGYFFAKPSGDVHSTSSLVPPAHHDKQNKLQEAVHLASNSNYSTLENQSQKNNAEAELDLYEKNFIGKGAASRELLDKIRSLGLPRSEANRKKIAQLLNGNITEDEKIGLVRLYAEQFDPQNPNNQILKDIENLYSGARGEHLKAEIALAYSRVGDVDKAYDFLHASMKTKTISEDQFYGELAHNFYRANQGLQQRIISDINTSRNNYAIQILTNSISTFDAVNLGGKNNELQIFELLKNNEPTFSSDGNFSTFESLAFKDWIVAYGKIQERITGNASESFKLNYLLSAGRDPRAILAFLSSAETADFARQNYSASQRQALFDSISRYSVKNPNDFVIAQVQDIYLRLLGPQK